MNQARPRYKNKILAALSKSEIERLSPLMSPVTLNQPFSLSERGGHAYFLEQGMASSVITISNGDTVEVGVTGKDGVVGMPALLGDGAGPVKTFMQISGAGYRVRVDGLKREFERPGELRRLIQNFMHAFLVQTAQTAACNRLHSIEERLARWLLTCHDRTEARVLPLTQEFLGQMLGAPRTTVTLAVGVLQHAGLIDHKRGHIVIRNRPRLEKMACECYCVIRDEYQRLALL